MPRSPNCSQWYFSVAKLSTEVPGWTQYCSWTITVSPAQQILLTFASFILQKEINTDGLYVFDGQNTTGKVLGVFYGDHPPPVEGIYSSSNHMFVMFISDNNGSYTGFNASYNAIGN